MVADAGEPKPTLLESVLGASPREFESRILRRADLQNPNLGNRRLAPGACVVSSGGLNCERLLPPS